MKLGNALLVLGVAAVVSVGGIATIKGLDPPRQEIRDVYLPASDVQQMQPRPPDDISQASAIDTPQSTKKPAVLQETPKQKSALVATAANDEILQPNGEENTAPAVTLNPGELPAEIAIILKAMQGPTGTTALELNRRIKNGIRTVKGDLAEQLLRNQMTIQPELRSLNVSVHCAAKLCELQAVLAVPGATVDSIDAAFIRVSRNRELTELYRPRAVLQLPMNSTPYWIWYWDERE